jgi:hypothetical protein
MPLRGRCRIERGREGAAAGAGASGGQAWGRVGGDRQSGVLFG